MATTLAKDVIRETTVEYTDRNIVLTLKASQEVSMKLKGMKSGDVSISIEELYKQLVGDDSETDKPSGGISLVNEEEEPVKKGKTPKGMILLNDLRSHNLVSALDIEDKVKFEAIILSVINQYKK